MADQRVAARRRAAANATIHNAPTRTKAIAGPDPDPDSSPIETSVGGVVGRGVAPGAGGLVGAGVGVGAGASCTVTLPVICGWIEQWYANVPAVENVTVAELPLVIGPVSNDAPSAVAVCAWASEFVHVTVSPVGTVIEAGENENPEIATA